jgi:hypothetical protein
MHIGVKNSHILGAHHSQTASLLVLYAAFTSQTNAMVARWVTEVTAMVHKHAGPHVQLLNTTDSTKQQQQCCSSSCDKQSACCSGCCSSDECCCCRSGSTCSSSSKSDSAPPFPQGRVGNCNTIIPITIHVGAENINSSNSSDAATTDKQVSASATFNRMCI